MNEEEIKNREEELKMIAKKIQQSGLQFPDIRTREWMNNDSKVSNLLNCLIEAENILLELDEYQMENGQNYPEFEDMMLQIGELRNQYTEFVDKNLELLKIK